ncbi:hypothetical protein DFS34DRAFT_636466, partial [Phlyctochytrium arcticum]
MSCLLLLFFVKLQGNLHKLVKRLLNFANRIQMFEYVLYGFMNWSPFFDNLTHWFSPFTNCPNRIVYFLQVLVHILDEIRSLL